MQISQGRKKIIMNNDGCDIQGFIIDLEYSIIKL